MQITGKQAFEILDKASLDGRMPATMLWQERDRGGLIAVWEGLGGVMLPTVTITGEYVQAFMQLSPEAAREVARLLLLAADKSEGK